MSTSYQLQPLIFQATKITNPTAQKQSLRHIFQILFDILESSTPKVAIPQVVFNNVADDENSEYERQASEYKIAVLEKIGNEAGLYHSCLRYCIDDWSAALILDDLSQMLNNILEGQDVDMLTDSRILDAFSDQPYLKVYSANNKEMQDYVLWDHASIKNLFFSKYQ
jgi:hypothetical protein